MGAPLAAGCTVVVKASELTPRTYYEVARCYIDAGVPPGAVNMISCRRGSAAELTTALIQHAAVRKVHFTGSTSVGRQIAAASALALKPCVMELGGKNSSLVLDDADLQTAATGCVLGSFLNSGQICMCTDRILVREEVAARFAGVLERVLGALYAGGNPPATLVGEEARQRVQGLVAEAIGKGARAVEGEWSGVKEGALRGYEVAGENANGVFMRPVVLRETSAEMRVWKEEVFGLVVSLVSVKSDEDAIRLANDTEYGLSASVFTEDLRRGFRVAKELDAGQVHINTMTIQDEPSMPFGGVKASGWGRFNNVEGVEEFLTTKSVTWLD